MKILYNVVLADVYEKEEKIEEESFQKNSLTKTEIV